MTDDRQPGALGRSVAIAADHAGIDIKTMLASVLRELGFAVTDLGPTDTVSVDYPDFAHRLARKIAAGDVDWGVLVCGSGVGMSIAANKVPGVRAALVGDSYTARLARNHNDANVIVFGARVIGPELMKACLTEFAAAAFTPGDDGRHRRRVDKLEIP